MNMPRHTLRQFERPLEDASEPVTGSSKVDAAASRPLELSGMRSPRRWVQQLYLLGQCVEDRYPNHRQSGQKLATDYDIVALYISPHQNVIFFLTPFDQISHSQFFEPRLRFGLGVFKEPVEALTDFDLERGTTARDDLPLQMADTTKSRPMAADLPCSAVFL
jgi:hypothetical protein